MSLSVVGNGRCAVVCAAITEMADEWLFLTWSYSQESLFLVEHMPELATLGVKVLLIMRIAPSH
jgi:hypothetical protein